MAQADAQTKAAAQVKHVLDTLGLGEAGEKARKLIMAPAAAPLVAQLKGFMENAGKLEDAITGGMASISKITDEVTSLRKENEDLKKRIEKLEAAAAPKAKAPAKRTRTAAKAPAKRTRTAAAAPKASEDPLADFWATLKDIG